MKQKRHKEITFPNTREAYTHHQSVRATLIPLTLGTLGICPYRPLVVVIPLDGTQCPHWADEFTVSI